VAAAAMARRWKDIPSSNVEADRKLRPVH
jgi:hypothetical protein